MTPTARGPGRTKAEPEPEHDSEHPDQEPGQTEQDTSAQQPQGSGGQKGALVDPSKSTEEVREDQAESYREGEGELSESEQVEQERLEYHQSIQDEIRAQQEDTGEEPLPNAEERAVKTAPAPGQVPGDHIPVG